MFATNRAILTALVAVFGLSLAPAQAATTYTYTVIDVPGAFITFGFGLNNEADAIVGAYIDPAPDFGGHGWLLQGGAFSTLDFPGADSTDANGINDKGQLVGCYLDAAGAQHGFRWQRGAFNNFDVPGSGSSCSNHINNKGQIVGGYSAETPDYFNDHGYVFSDGVFTTIDYPGAIETEVLGINSKGDIVGGYMDAARVVHGFLYVSGVFSPIDFPNAPHSLAYGINNRGQIVGRYVTSTNVFSQLDQHSYLLSGGAYTNVDPPGTTGRSLAASINNAGQIVGVFRNSTGRHAYLANPAGDVK